MAQRTKGGGDSFPLWGSRGMLPSKNVKFRSSEMQFTVFEKANVLDSLKRCTLKTSFAISMTR